MTFPSTVAVHKVRHPPSETKKEAPKSYPTGNSLIIIKCDAKENVPTASSSRIFEKVAFLLIFQGTFF